MTVKQLIIELQELDPALDVVADAIEVTEVVFVTSENSANGIPFVELR